MIVFLPLGLALLFFGLWYYRRGSSLSRMCRWRQRGAGAWECVACGARMTAQEGKAPPQVCLKPKA